jgi:hypothetical protein
MDTDFKEESSKETAFVYNMKDGIGAVTFPSDMASL